MSDQAKRIRLLDAVAADVAAVTGVKHSAPPAMPTTEAEFLGNFKPIQDAVNRSLVAVADIAAAVAPEPSRAETLLAVELERVDLAGQAAADTRLAAEAQLEKARAALDSGEPALEVAAVVAAVFTSLVEAHTYEQAAAHERTREHTRTTEGETHEA
ncbi:hypothetical protein BJH93_04025 [Kocuria polaris]|nr:hypothetical protein [Kocuria polaris]